MQSFMSKFVALFASIILWFTSVFGLGAKGQNAALRLLYPDYAGARTQLDELPGLADGFTPQGVTYLPEEDVYLLCGYMDDGTASRLYVLRGGEYTELTMLQQNGSVYTGHAGGITAAGAYVYISNNKRLYVLEKAAVLSANGGDELPFVGSVAVPCRASFCASDAQRVYVGEYHRDEGYETDPSHELTAPDGTVYKALVFGYTISPDAPFGLLSDSPAVAFSTCDNVQGFTLTPDGTAVLSCSAGSSDSKLRFYHGAGEPDGAFPLDGDQIPLYYLTGERLLADITLPRMSEDIEYDDGEIVLVFESGAKQYASNRPFAEKNIVRLSVDALLK
ncbi:MAG: hypothetical protein IK118_08945 [Clostridia bacterium]|nr:hypothetical protein [Clostridia bacterium]